MKKELLDILVCPKSKMPLVFNKATQELCCKESKLAYPVRDDIPVLLVDEARTLSEEELQHLKT
jgi:uncharacterized protein YbaR (Trm112 family)